MSVKSPFRMIIRQLCLGLILQFQSSAASGDQIPFLMSGNKSYYQYKLLVAGNQFYLGRRTSASGWIDTPDYLIRLNADGSRDPDFNVAPLLGEEPSNPGYHGFGWSGATLNGISHYTLRETGHLLVTGHFGNGNDSQTVQGPGAYGFSVDPAGNGKPDFKTPASLTLYSFARGTVLQPDGKILVNPDVYKSDKKPRLIRLNADFTQDTDFSAPNITTEAALSFSAAAVQADGKILISGSFTPAGGSGSTNFVRRLNPDGSPDPQFEKYFDILPVSILTLSPTGILIGGGFTKVDGKPFSNLVLIRNDGTLDETFNPQVNGQVNSLTQQTDGKILIGGAFTSIGGIPRNLLARLNADGSLDSTFAAALAATYLSGTARQPGAVEAVSLLGNGEILALGSFATTDGVSRTYAKFANTPSNSVLKRAGASVARWLPGSTAPVVNKVIFEHQLPDSTVWTPVGNGSRGAGGWELRDVPIPTRGQLRVRGILPVSGGWVETVTGLGISLPEWRAHHFGSAENTGAGADFSDPDGDSYPNLVEYLSDSDPETPSAFPLPPWTVSGEFLECRLPVPEGLSPLNVTAEWTSDPAGPWQSVSDSGGGMERVFRIPLQGQARLFTRLKVSRD